MEGRHVGNSALMPDLSGQTATFGIIIGDKTAWGRGYGTAALREVLRIGFQEMGLHRIHLQAFAGNARGIHCYEKCGFRHEGLACQARFKRGEWVDVLSMAVLREEWEGRWDSRAPDADDIRIRSYRGSDHAQAVELWRKVGFNPIGKGNSRAAIEYKVANDRGPFLVAELEGQMVGTAMASWDGRWAWVYRVAVDPDHQRQGIGRRLMEDVERRLAGLGATRIHLVTGESNGAAREFYESLGYEIADDVVVMRKALTAKGEAR